ncbi:MAG: AMP-binding protein [Polyangiaceae bacterium]
MSGKNGVHGPGNGLSTLENVLEGSTRTVPQASAAASPEASPKGPLSIREQIRGRRFVVVGGTGFLGKVWWAMLLHHFPELERIYLVVRERMHQTAQERFDAEIITSEVMTPLRARYGDGYEAFMRDKIVPIPGDVSYPFCGLPAPLRDELRGSVDAVINAAGVVDFDPPLDQALDVNAFGVQNLIALVKDLQGAKQTKLMHTSTCFTAGDRTGFIEELDPRLKPFPKAGQLEEAHWDPEGEIAECLDVIEQARHRANDKFRQSRFLDEARTNLEKRGEPARGPALSDEIERVRRKFIEAQLAELGTERANFWGWSNTYTYTKSIGEQIIANSGVEFTIVRPAIIESSCEFPIKGWAEGINTSAPLIYSLREGQTQIPGSDNYLDFIPCDMVAGAMTLSLAELLEGTAPLVYQYASSDTNPCTMRRFFELSGLYKRKYYQKTGRGGPLLSYVQAHFEGALLTEKQFHSYGPPAVSKASAGLSGLLKRAGVGPAAPILKPLAKVVGSFGSQQDKVGSVLGQFLPFVCRYHYIFRCDNTRAAYARLSEEEQRLTFWEPEKIDWREWFMDVHMPGLEKHVFPLIDERVKKERPAPRRHETLTELLLEMAQRHDLAVALQRTEEQGLSRLSFREWRDHAFACAARLEAQGVQKGDRVLLAGANHPAWSISFFGILLAGATVVPLDANVEAQIAANLQRASGARIFISDLEVKERCAGELGDSVVWLRYEDVAAEGELPKWAHALESAMARDVAVEPEQQVAADARRVTPDDVACLIYTSGTTGSPKGVMLTHQNLTALVASLAPLFPLGKRDRVLSVLPLHHTFELTCGMLLPLSRGCRIVYLDELNAERLEVGLNEGRITAMVGVPALWEMLERRMLSKVAERGALASRVFDVAVEVNRSLGKSLGLDTGRLLFGPVHQGLGGHLRYLVSGGAALPESTHKLFSGLGLHLAEGYGLTEASPVLTVAPGGPKAKAGHVGKPIPGVEIRIHEPNAEGVGEVFAKGPNVMLGYADDEAATTQVIDSDGWLHTGDLGKLDRQGRLTIVGRAKDTIVTSSGENVYPDDVEARLGKIEHIEEYAILGVDDPRGGERIACVAVPEEDPEHDRAARHARARQSLERALNGLPAVMRPGVTTLLDVALPRTATRKVKRRELRRLLDRVAPLSERPPRLATQGVDASGFDAAARMVRVAVATITRRKENELRTDMSLRGDLGFDSLMLLELLVALEGQSGRSVDAERLTNCHTIGDAEALMRELRSGRTTTALDTRIEKEADEPLEIPEPMRKAAMEWLGRGQMGFYDKVLTTKVYGRAFLPHNRNTLVAANHASHLDMGLVKYALGGYGQDMVSLAAQDYFFEGGKWRKAYFENLTNLVPMSRSGSLRQSLRQAGELLERGNVVLVFPEGTRSVDGAIHEFKPAVGHLSLQYNTDILPVYLGGTFSALPKGALALRSRKVHVRIGPPLEVADLRRLTEGMSVTEASRAVARLAQRAVEELAAGRVLDLRQLKIEDVTGQKKKETLAEVFKDLESRFQVGSIEEAVSYYFSLGDGERWSMQISPQNCRIWAGKPEGDADCVLKTSPAMFTRIVREAYTPSPSEFMAGTVKSNNIGLLVTFQKAFGLQSES